ncbi:MAG TPA: hypothetical protein VFG89_07335 [Coriobacteriia bacterium]|nr:hypothetical protein [Coriobacteriia bacterium]
MRGVVIAAALLLGIGVPAAGIALLVPSLESSSKALVTNYRGRKVFYGLGVAWLLWAGSAMIAGVAPELIAGRSVIRILLLAGPLALVAFALGAVDDAYGTADARGFKGHIKALLAGRLTTGGMKLFGLSLASLIVALVIEELAPWGTVTAAGLPGAFTKLGLGLLAGASIALTSNFVNLTDLRPGRALKVYSVLAVFGVLSTALLFGANARAFDTSLASRVIDVAALLLFALGPVIAVWRYDLGERGMLGDAGANPMGAVAGLLIVAGLPLWALAVYFVVIFGLNLASEKVSFSKVIAASRLLSRIDDIGRLPQDELSSEINETCPPTDTNPE